MPHSRPTASLPPYCSLAVSWRIRGCSWAQVRDDERVTLGDVCAKLPDCEERLQSRSGSPAGTGSVGDEPRRSSSLRRPPRQPFPRLLTIVPPTVVLQTPQPL